MSKWPPPTYQIRRTFRAPRDFVFRWCTDYRPDDAKRSRETYERRILHRSPRRVLYEDLWWAADGWRWRRSDVRLSPPSGWHSDSIGNFRDASIDYRLRSLSDRSTELTLRMRRRPGPRAIRNPPRAVLEKELRELWGYYARALESDYRRVRRPGTSRSPRSRARRARR